MLDYLDFETSDDGEGITTFDALAYTSTERWPALHAEVELVLRWCTTEFGPPGPLERGHPWDVDVQLQSDAGHALAVRWDGKLLVLVAGDVVEVAGVQLWLTVSGGEEWAQALVEQFFT